MDMPMGLLDTVELRVCDQMAKRLLGVPTGDRQRREGLPGVARTLRWARISRWF
jgi:hypothetical protein